MPHGLTGHFLPVRRRCHSTYFNKLKCRPWFLCSLCFSFTYRFWPVSIARLPSLTGVISAKDIRPYWFSAVFHGCRFQRRQHPHQGQMAVLSSLHLRAVLSRHLSVATKHTGHDRFIASCGTLASQTMFPLFTELHTFHMTLWCKIGRASCRERVSF